MNDSKYTRSKRNKRTIQMRYMNIITTIHLICIIRYPKTISVLCFLTTLFDAKISMSRLEFDRPENVFFEFDRKLLTSFINKYWTTYKSLRSHNRLNKRCRKFEFRKLLTSLIEKISHVSEKKSYVENLNFGFDRKLLTSFIDKISHVSEKNRT